MIRFFSKCFNEYIKRNKVESLNYGISKGQTNVCFTNQHTMQYKFIITVSDAKDNDLNDTASGIRLTCNYKNCTFFLEHGNAHIYMYV